MRQIKLAHVFLIAGLAILTPGRLGAAQWGADYFPNTPVITQDGKVVHFYDDLIKNKIVVVNFVYTSCKDICPLASARMAQLQDALGGRVGRDIFLYSISIDPVHDTPERLKQYADAFHAGPSWLFLTGAPEDIKQIRWKLGERSRALWEHRNDIMLGNGATGEWQRDSMLADVDRLMEVIRQMDPRWRNQAHPLPRAVAAPDRPEPASTAVTTAYPPKVVHADTQFKLNSRPGEALFVKACAGCHTIGKGSTVGPDLDGLTVRRSRSWITDFLMNPEKMRTKKDPIEMSLIAKFPAVRMPFLQINEADAADLIAYINTHSTKGTRAGDASP